MTIRKAMRLLRLHRLGTTGLNCPAGHCAALRRPGRWFRHVTPPSPLSSWDRMQLRPSSHAHVTCRLIIGTSIQRPCDGRSGQSAVTRDSRVSAGGARVCRRGVSVCSDSHRARYEDILVRGAAANEGAGHVMRGKLAEGSGGSPAS